MNPRVREKFEEICIKRWNGRGRVLEIGAVADDESLLSSHVFAQAEERIGINLEVVHEGAGFRIVKGTANDMSMFKDDSFDLVMSNSVLEHDPMFWRTLREVTRVTKPSALILIGVPGFTDIRWLRQLQRSFCKVPFLGKRRKSSWFDGVLTSTITYQIHNHPGDFYRFSEQAMVQVLLAGCVHVEIKSVLIPPRVIGSGYLWAGVEPDQARPRTDN